MKKLLLSFAHPDDESFAVGGTIAKYVKAGWCVKLVCATFGQAGRSGDYQNIEGDALGAIRKAELEEAAKVLGIFDISYLEHQDGTLENLDDGKLEGNIFYEMVNFAPDVVITFDTTGISNHPDHIKMCYATTYAFQKYVKNLHDTRDFVADVNMRTGKFKKRKFLMQHKSVLKSEAFIDKTEEVIEPKLYYICVPGNVARYLQQNKVMQKEMFGGKINGTDDDRITTAIDISRFEEVKRRAMSCHRSQVDDVKRHVNFPNHPLFKQEYFILRMVGDVEFYMGKNDRVADRL